MTVDYRDSSHLLNFSFKIYRDSEDFFPSVL